MTELLDEHEIQPDFIPRSSNSALISVVSTFVYPRPHPVPTAAFQYVLGLLGYEANTTRQALVRTTKRGILESVRHGRQSVWQLSPTGHSFIQQGTVRLRALNRSRGPWDGQFVTLIAPVPEKDRALRRQFRTKLMWAGFGSPHPGMWISPHREAEAAAQEILTEIPLFGAYSFVSRVGSIGDVTEFVRQAWDLSELNSRYASFVDQFKDVRSQSGDEGIRNLVLLVHAWRRFPFYDPALPRELLPDDWRGVDGASLFSAQQALWTQPASERWQEIVESSMQAPKTRQGRAPVSDAPHR